MKTGSPQRLAMNKFARGACLLSTILAWGIAPLPASAEIYSFTDENGVLHFSNVPTDERYVPLSAPNAVAKRTVGGSSNNQAASLTKAQYVGVIEEVARTYGLESALIHAVVSVESAYRVTAVSRKGAGGLMQLMPETAQRYGVTDRFDPVQNLHGGARYLSDLLKMFNGDIRLTLAATTLAKITLSNTETRFHRSRKPGHYVPKVHGALSQVSGNLKVASTAAGNLKSFQINRMLECPLTSVLL